MAAGRRGPVEQRVEVIFYEAQVPADGGRRCDQKGDFTLLTRIRPQIADMLTERLNGPLGRFNDCG